MSKRVAAHASRGIESSRPHNRGERGREGEEAKQPAIMLCLRDIIYAFQPHLLFLLSYGPDPLEREIPPFCASKY